MQAIPSWLWITAGWCIAAPGLWLVLLGRIRLRQRPGRLCRKCGYDMAGLAGLRCPECGRTARDEREVMTRPRGWRLRGVGAVLLVVACIVPRGPQIVKHGLVGGIPDWPLAVIAPTEDRAVGLILDAEPRWTLRALGVRYDRFMQALHDEAERRVDWNDTGEGAGAHYLRRFHRTGLDTLESDLLTPAFWPQGEGLLPVHYHETGRPFNFASSGPAFHIFVAVSAVDERAGTMTCVARVSRGGHSYVLATVVRRVNFSLAAGELMEVAGSPALDAAVAQTVRPTVLIKDGVARLRLFDGGGGLECFAPCTVTLRIGGEAVLSQACDLCPSEAGSGSVLYELNLKPAELARLLKEPASVEVEITANPERAIRVYRLSWWLDRSGTRPKAWGGSVRVKPRIDLAGEERK